MIEDFSKIGSLEITEEIAQLTIELERAEKDLKSVQDEERMHYYKKDLTEEENANLNKKIFEARIRIKHIKEIMAQKQTLADSIHRDKDGIIITDDEVEGYSKRKQGDFDVDKESERIVIVHCTDFFPSQHKILSSFDGEKETDRNRDITFDGNTKFCRALAHRNTIHSTLNARVGDTSDGAGTWNGKKYMIIEPFARHKEQFAVTDPSDAYTDESIELSEDAVIMIREDAFDEIPPEIRSQFNIVRFSGDATRCLENFLRMNGYDIFETYADARHHSLSKHMSFERALNTRDGFINYIRDNTYLSRELIELSEEELCTLCNIAKQNQNRLPNFTTTFDELAKEKGISPEIFRFYITSGFKSTDDGNYTFKSDEEIFEIIGDLYDVGFKDSEIDRKEEYEKVLISHGINIEEIKTFYDAYCEREFKEIESSFDTFSFFKQHVEDKNVYEEFEKEYKEKCKDKIHLDPDELKKFYELQHEKYLAREQAEAEQSVLTKKMEDFEGVYNEETDDYDFPNVSKKELDIYIERYRNPLRAINKEIALKGNNKFFFSMVKDSLALMPLSDEAEEEINSTLEGTEHYRGKDEFREGAAILDFKRKPDETLAEFLVRLEKYTNQFIRYYNGENLDESIHFDENGDVVELPEVVVGKDDFREVAESREASEQLQSGNIINEISSANLEKDDQSKGEELDD